MGAKLSAAKLSGAKLSGAKLIEAKLIGAKLIGANLSDTSLSDAKLSFANLSYADLSRADLSRADLSATKLIEAKLSGADLSGADFKGADLSGADFKGTNLSGANFKTEVISTLRIRIEEQPLTASRLSETLDTLISLYVKMWLLQQNRFDDFIHYTESKDRHFEEEAHLLIEELKYNSPADIKFNIDLSPKAVIEALQVLVDMITQRKQRKQTAALELLKEQISVLDQSVETAKRIVETLSPELNGDQKNRAMQR